MIQICGVIFFGDEHKVIKLDIVNRLSNETGVPKQKAEQVVESLFNAMKDALANGQRIELKPRKRGIGRNPRTGEEVAIPLGKTIRFKPGKDLQPQPKSGDARNNGKTTKKAKRASE